VASARERVSDIVTRERRRRSALEVMKQLEWEVDADRFVGLAVTMGSCRFRQTACSLARENKM
jgi:hypothetical protein